MSRDTPDDDAFDDYIEPVPVWRRPKVVMLAGAAALALMFIFTRGKAPANHDDAMKNDAFIGVVVPYQAAKAEPPPDPAPVKAEVHQPPPVAAPQAPPAPPVQSLLPRMPLPPGVAPKPPRPVMLSYVVPHTDGPKPAAPAPAEAPETGVAFKTETLPGTKASPALDQTYMLMPGLLPVVLDTAISSDAPNGSILGHLPGPVYSPKGVLLMEAGTQIIGKYTGLAQGSHRLQAVSTYAITPNGIFVPITDSMSDDLGRNGLDGSVNNRYMERFGAAIILTLSQSVLGIIQAEASKGGDTYLNLNSGGGVGGVAQQILQSTINLPSIFEKHQGETIAIFLSQPVDFSASYRVRSAR